MDITAEYFIDVLEDTNSITATAEILGISKSHAYTLASKYKKEIQERARDSLTLDSLKAVKVVREAMSADSSMEKGELRLKAAESVLDRSGVTKHTHLEVSVGDTNGLFIIPAKSEVPPPPPEES